MTSLLIIADDFTGALDTGIQTAKLGIDTLVTTCARGLTKPAPLPNCEVAVVDAETRHLPAAQAYARVREIVGSYRETGLRCIYKKTDSTLRGNVGAELQAVMDATGANELAFLPAMPRSGRTTRNGIQYVNGVPLAETEFARDPFNPVAESDVARIIGMQTDTPVISVPRADYGAPGAQETGRCIFVLDAETDEDVRRAARALGDAGRTHLLAGCAGFAEALPDLLKLPRAAADIARAPGATLLVRGSVHPMSVLQTETAVRALGYADAPLSPRALLSGRASLDPVRLLSGAGRAVVRVSGGREAVEGTRDIAAEFGISREDTHAAIAARLGEAVADLLRTGAVGTLIVFGGDTLLGIATALGVHTLRPLRELLPGVALAHLEYVGRHLDVVSKAGGFGGADVVAEIERALAGNSENPRRE